MESVGTLGISVTFKLIRVPCVHLKVCVWLWTLWGSSEHYFSCGLVSVDSCKPRNQPMKTPTMVLGLYCKSISGQVLTTSNQPTHCFKQQPGNSSAAAGASLSYQLATGNSAAFLADISVASLRNGVCSAWASCTDSSSCGFGGALWPMRAALLSSSVGVCAGLLWPPQPGLEGLSWDGAGCCTRGPFSWWSILGRRGSPEGMEPRG